MKTFISRVVLAVAFLSVLPLRAPAQDRVDDYRRLFKKPANTAQFWDAMKFEMELGRFDLAAQLLSELLKKGPTEKELIDLHEKEGIAPFLRLRLVPRWDNDPRRDKKVRDDVDDLIKQMTTAVRKNLADPNRIKLFTNNLYGTPEENAFARIELARSGAVAVPYVLEELLKRDEKERSVIVNALSQFGPDTVPPLVVALDSNNAKLREHILEVLSKRRDLVQLEAQGIVIAPFLWPLTSPLEPSALVRSKARDLLARLKGFDSPEKLPAAKEALTAEAERYYYHRVRFPDPRQVPVWRYRERPLVELINLPASVVEEYYGLRFARQALDIDPRYEPAQLVFLSLVLDKGYGPRSDDRPLGVLKPNIQELLTRISPDLLGGVLDRALRDGRTRVVLGAVKALGDLADVRAIRPGPQGEPPLVRALAYGDRRVQMAAVDSLLRIPGVTSTQAAARIVQILKEMLITESAANDRPRILVGLADEDLRNEVGRTVRAIGAEPLLASTGRNVLRRLKARSDVDAVVIDSVLPNPGLASLLAQLRADQSVGRLPVLLAAVPESRRSRDLLERLGEARRQLAKVDADIRSLTEEQVSQANVVGTRGQVLTRNGRELEDLRKQRAGLEATLLSLSDRYDVEVQRREDQLSRFVEKYRNIWVVSTTQLNDPRLLQGHLEDRLNEAGMPALSKAERKALTESAIGWLARMALAELRGFDVRPAGDAVLEALHRGRQKDTALSEPALVNAIRIAGTLSGSKVHSELIEVLFDKGQSVPVRVAAAEELQKNIQKFGRLALQQEAQLRTRLQADLKEPAFTGPLRDWMARLDGTLRPNDRTTGQRLRDFVP
ncbi:MAG: hypothetical protein HYS12_07405 [Planctomycetes bacterium]|nr:hypothetical protein [Planctomycetota bacterium]